METDKRVQFVCFETKLNKEEFVKRWGQFGHSLNSNTDVTLQQSEKDGVFKYIAQHRLASDELEFKFSSEGRTSRIVQIPIRTTQAGGYSVLQTKRSHDTASNESKVFVFFTTPKVDLNIYKKLFAGGDLNIYQAYYENCKFTYILEYYTKTKDAAQVLQQLSDHDIADIGIYKEWAHVKNTDTEKPKNFVWPT